jgi:hypothetical protein
MCSLAVHISSWVNCPLKSLLFGGGFLQLVLFKQNKARGMAQVAEILPAKCKALRSNSSTITTKKINK